MRFVSSWLLGLFALPALALAQTAPTFEAPVRLKDADGPIKVEAPGFAFPAWHDVDGDGKHDLVVGQFRDGKMKVHRGLGAEGFAAGTWIMADGKVAQVPGVW